MSEEFKEPEDIEDIEDIMDEERDRMEEERERMIEEKVRVHSSRSRSRGRGHKSVTIRGVNSEIYEQFAKKMKISEMNIGDALSKMMTDVMADFDEVFPDLSSESLRDQIPLKRISINHHDELSISRKDLEDSNARISFNNIDLLTFEKDVSRDDFIKFVRSINHCDEVKLPSVLPKLIALSLMNSCENVEMYDVE